MPRRTIDPINVIDLSEASLSVIHYLDRSLSMHSARMAELKSMIRFRSLGLEVYAIDLKSELQTAYHCID